MYMIILKRRRNDDIIIIQNTQMSGYINKYIVSNINIIKILGYMHALEGYQIQNIAWNKIIMLESCLNSDY